jgi:probable F420-dependent oxidoreductase
VEYGVFMFATDESVDPITLGKAVEEAGFSILLLPEHTHIPASRETPYPAGGDLPREYWRSHDPFVALTAIAATTERLRIGTGVCLVVERDPIITAKEVASLDVLSGGRFEFGVGAGWNREEMRNHGTDPRHRMDLLRERIEAMQAIWAADEPEYHGDHVDFDPLWSWPKPLQRPHPPILVGGVGPTVLDRVLAFGDGWMPTRGDDGWLAERIAELDERARAAGRGTIPVTLYGALPREEALARYAEMGVARCVFWLPSARPDEVLGRVERYGALVRGDL